VDSWDYRPYRASAELVFCDACDRMPGACRGSLSGFFRGQAGWRHLGATTTVTAEGPTADSGNGSPRELPVFQIEGTVMLCLRVDPKRFTKKTQALLEHPLLKNSIHIAGASRGPGG